MCRRLWWTSLYSASEDSATFRTSLNSLLMAALKLSNPVKFFTLSSIPPWISTLLPTSSRTSKSPSLVSRSQLLISPWNAPMPMVIFPPFLLLFLRFLFFFFYDLQVRGIPAPCSIEPRTGTFLIIIHGESL